MEPIIMVLVYKIFNMRKYLLFSCLIFLTLYTNGQIVPIGTIIKTNSLNSVNIILNIPGDIFNTFSYRVQGVVVQGGSKSPIVENGFVIKERNNSLLPDILNAQKISSNNGILDFTKTIDLDTRGGRDYHIRAYIINSFGQVSYSQVREFETPENFCYVNPCFNFGRCINSIAGPLCLCSSIHCGDCCADRAEDVSCPGGQLNNCSRFSRNRIAVNESVNKYNYFNSIIKKSTNNSIWEFFSK
jgi:hypothetical protein